MTKAIITMKRLLTLAFLLPLFALAQQSNTSFTIEGKLDGFTDGTKISLYQNGAQTPWLTTTLQKGKFSFTEKAEEPLLCFIVIENEKSAIELYVESGTISVKGNKNQPGKFDISGSKSHKEFREFVDAFTPVAQQLNNMAAVINGTMPGQQRDSLMNVYTGMQESLQSEIDKFINNKPSSFVSVFILNATYRFNGGYASPVIVDRYEALDAIMEAAVEQPERRILVDLAAQTHDPLVRWMDDSGVLNLADETGVAIHYWHVMDTGKDSVDLLARLLDRFGTGLKYVLVRNQVRGNDFSVLEQSGQQARALGLGARIVSVKKLHESAINKIDATSSSFWTAKNGDGHPSLGLMDRQRVKMWLRDVYRDLDEVGV